MTINSQRSFRHFFLSIFFFDLFFLTLAFFVWAIRDQAVSTTGYYSMLLIVLILILGAIYVPYRYYKNAPNISINEESISFNKEKLNWTDLEEIEMTGKRPFKFMWERREGLMLKFKGITERYIFDDLYENTPAIKTFIQTITLGQQLPNSTNSVFSGDQSIESGKFVYYKSYQLFCIEGIALWLFCGGAFYAALRSIVEQGNKQMFWPPTLFILIFLPFLSTRMYYFGLSDKYLLVKNHNFFWIKKRYDLAGVKEVVFEQRNRMPVTLRIINNDFTSQAFPAATLWSKKWMQLKQDLENKNIKVRNECGVSYEPFEFKLFND